MVENLQNYNSVVHIFKNTGKWYADIVISFEDKHNYLVKDAFIMSLREYIRPGDFEGMIAVCIKPAHPHPSPQMIRIDTIWDVKEEPNE